MVQVAPTIRTRESRKYKGPKAVDAPAPRNFTGFLFFRAIRAVCAVRDAVR